MGGVDATWATGRRVNAAMGLLRFPLGLSASAETGGGFSAVTTFLRFPGPGFGKAPPLEPAWFDEAEFVILETESAGFVNRRLAIEEFVVPVN